MVYLWIIPLIAIIWGIQSTLKYIIGPYLVVTNNWYKMMPLRYRFFLINKYIQSNGYDRDIIQQKLITINHYQISIVKSPFIPKQIKDSFNESLNVSLFAITRRWFFAYKAKIDRLTLHEFNNLTHEKMFINELNKVSYNLSELLIQTNYPETIQANELTRVQNNPTLSISTQTILHPVLTRLKNAKKLTQPNSENALILSRLI